MKKLIQLIVAIITLSSVKPLTAQVSVDFLKVMPKTNSSFGKGGFGMNILSSALNSTDVIGKDHIEYRVGGGFYFSGLDRKTVSGVPLSSAQASTASVTFNNKIRGLNGIMRFSLPYSNRIIPYGDVFAGIRTFTTVMNVDPDPSTNGCNCNTPSSENISKLNELDYGVSGGVMVSLSSSVKLDVALTYSDSNRIGKTISVNSAHLQGNTVDVNQTNAPTDMLMATIGLTYCFDGAFSRWASEHSYASSGYVSSPSYNNSNNNRNNSNINNGYTNYSQPSPALSSPSHCSGDPSNVSVHISSGRAK